MKHVVEIIGSINFGHVGPIQDAIHILKSNEMACLEIHIDSDGGDPDQAYAIYNLLGDYRHRTTAISGQKCMSSAVIIFLAADTRLANAYTSFMIHPTSWTLWGMYGFMKSYIRNVSDLTLTLSEVYTIQGQLHNAEQRLTEIENYTDEIFRTRANLTDTRFKSRRLVNTDQYITADDSLKLGISTKII